MALVSSLSYAQLQQRLAGSGIVLQTGSFTTHLRSPVRQIAEGIALLYADYPLHDDAAFADFHVEMDQVGGLRRWFGRQVIFRSNGEAPFKPLPLTHALPMLEWSMNWCVSSRAHDYLIIHAAVVERNGVAAILPAPPGSGKSTLCAALVSCGWRLLSDELTLVRLADGMIEPLPRPVSLKNSSIAIIGDFAPQAVFSRPVPNTNKGTVAHVKAPAASVARAGELARAAWIIFPVWTAGAAATMTPIPQAHAFMQVAQNAFNYSLLGYDGFDAMGRLIAHVDSYHFVYSKLNDAIALFERLAADHA